MSVEARNIRPRRSTRLLVAPSARATDAGVVARAASILCALGIFTVSWERLANVGAGPYNVKISVLLFAVAALLGGRSWSAALRALATTSRSARAMILIAGAVVGVFAVRAVFTQPVGPGLAQTAAVLTGAVLPMLAVVGVVRGALDVAWALRWFIGGAVLASAFGLYQLLAFYTGLPQGIAYTGVGTSGSGGRISAFSYEPAYFAYFLILTLGALLALAHLEGRAVRWGPLFFFAFVLALVNVRALLFLLPVAAVLLALSWRRNRDFLVRAVITGLAAGALAFVVPVGATALVTSLQAHDQRGTAAEAGGGNDEPEVSGAPTAPSEERSESALDDPGSVQSAVPTAPSLPSDVLDPNEVSSNGPRLALYRAVLQVDLAHPLLGVGPGALRDALAETGYVAPNQGSTVVANNIWLQAGADGGVLLLLLEVALVVTVAVLWWRDRKKAQQALLSVWLAVVLVGGMLTSYFFDIKLWVVLALAIALLADRRRPLRRLRASAGA